MKICKKCGELDQAKFYRTAHYCKVCHREWVRDSRLRKLGVTREQYLATLAGQLGACAVCGSQERPVEGTKRGLHQDHNHKTGQVRGILCANCNQVLGRVRDSVSHLTKLIEYLKLYP